MMLTSVPRTDRLERGFTLMELLVVLGVISIVSLGVATMIGRRPAATERTQLSIKVQAAIKTARHDARRHGNPVKLDMSTLGSTTQVIEYRPLLAVAGKRLTFYSDGSSSGGEILLNGRPLLMIDWLTGGADDASNRG